MEIPSQIQSTLYDNDVTLLYKWAAYFQLPVRLIIPHPPSVNASAVNASAVNASAVNASAVNASNDKMVYESLPGMVSDLLNKNYTAAEIYDIIIGYNPYILSKDILMVYYGIISNERKDSYLLDMNNFESAMNNDSVVSRFETDEELAKEYAEWIKDITEESVVDSERLNEILEVQETLEDVATYEKIPVGQVTINSTVVSYSPTINGKPVTIDDGIDIFADAVVSKYVPYIKYNDKTGHPSVWIYSGGKMEVEPNYSLTILDSNDNLEPNTIYLNLWWGTVDENFDTAPKESFFTVVYNLSKNYLEIEAPVGADPKKGLIRNEAEALRRITDALPMLDFGIGKEVKVRGDFDVWGSGVILNNNEYQAESFEFEESSFVDRVLNDPNMNVYMYIEENSKPFAFKKRLDIHYRSIYSDLDESNTEINEAYISNSAAVSITVSTKTAEEQRTVNTVDPVTKETKSIIIPSGSKYLHVNISQAKSKESVDSFVMIFQLLLRYYLQERDAVIQVYYSVLPRLQELSFYASKKKIAAAPVTSIAGLTKRKAPAKRASDKIAQLHAIAGDLFVTDYARDCQCSAQPIIIKPEEVAAWKSNTFTLKDGRVRERQVMEYPYKNGKLLIVCPDDVSPYPGVKINKKLNNRDKYPYIPCCFKTNKMSESADGNWNNFMAGILPEKNPGAKADKKITTGKFLSPGRMASIPSSVQKIISAYSPNSVDMVRYGVKVSPNALIHCVALAVDDPIYMDPNTSKEDYVRQIRQYIAKTINPTLLKQEMYDYTEEEILKLMSDDNYFFDPFFFYRAIEETYNINLYIFSPDPDDKEDGIVEIPRFKIFHSHAIRSDRPVVLIYKFPGSESDALEHEHCELIIDYDQSSQRIVKIFGDTMNTICHKAITNSMKTLNWSLTSNNTFDVNQNIYYNIDHLMLFSYPAVAQFIDANGKMRALILNVDGEEVTLATIPSQPENLPSLRSIPECSIEAALKLLPNPIACTRNSKKEITGLWYQIMDIKYGEYIPIKATAAPNLSTLPTGPHNPILSFGKSVTNRLTVLRRNLKLITQLIKWVYTLASTREAMNAGIFALKYITINNAPVEDSAAYYDLSKIKRKLPIVETPEDGIRVLSKVAPTLFNPDVNKIVMYDYEFFLRILKMLTEYEALEVTTIPLYIENYYESEKDFNQRPNAKIFLNLTDLSSWLTSLKSLTDYSKYYSIHQDINVGMYAASTPYLYQDENKKIYIVQNVQNGLKSKALDVAATWFENKINLGFNADVLDKTPVHMVYGVSPGSKIIPIDDQTYNSPSYVKILYYGNQQDYNTGRDGRYAALLELL